LEVKGKKKLHNQAVGVPLQKEQKLKRSKLLPTLREENPGVFQGKGEHTPSRGAGNLCQRLLITGLWGVIDRGIKKDCSLTRVSGRGGKTFWGKVQIQGKSKLKKSRDRNHMRPKFGKEWEAKGGSSVLRGGGEKKGKELGNRDSCVPKDFPGVWNEGGLGGKNRPQNQTYFQGNQRRKTQVTVGF